MFGVTNAHITLPVTETKLGSDCSGSNGAANRTLTLANTSLSLHSQGFSIFVNGTGAHEGTGNDYTRSGNVITFLNNIDNGDEIQVNYFTWGD